MPRTAITQLAKLIGQELESGAGPSEQGLATGPMLAEAGATTEIVERLFAEAQRKDAHGFDPSQHGEKIDLATLDIVLGGGFESVAGGTACARKTATAEITGHIISVPVRAFKDYDGGGFVG